MIMKICMVSSFPPERNGIANYASNIINSMKNQNRKIDFLLLSPEKGDLPKKSKFGNIKVHRIWGKENPLYFSKLIEEVSNYKPDVVHIQHAYAMFGKHFGLPLLPFLIYCKFKKIPTIVTLHTVWVLSELEKEYVKEGKLKTKLAKFMFYLITKLIEKLSSKIIILNPVSIGKLKKEYGLKEENLIFIHLGLERKKNIEQKIAKEKLSLKGKFVLTCFGIPYRTKGYEYVIMAMPKILKRSPNALLLIVGDNTDPTIQSYVEKLKRLISDLNLSKNVVFTGFVEEKKLPLYLSATDIGILPHLSLGGVSTAFYFMIMYKKPMIVTKIDCFKEITNLENGLVVPTKNSNAIAKAVIKLLNDKKLYSKIKRNLEKFLNEENNIKTVSKKTLDLYKDLIPSK